jgi:hypothetical protein
LQLVNAVGFAIGKATEPIGSLVHHHLHQSAPAACAFETSSGDASTAPYFAALSAAAFLVKE